MNADINSDNTLDSLKKSTELKYVNDLRDSMKKHSDISEEVKKYSCDNCVFMQYFKVIMGFSTIIFGMTRLPNFDQIKELIDIFAKLSLNHLVAISILTTFLILAIAYIFGRITKYIYNHRW